MTSLSGLAREILKAGLDDWVPVAEIDGIARQRGESTEEEIRDWSIEAIKELAQADLVEIGELSPRFSPWNEPLDESLQRIRHVWDTTVPDVWYWAVWLSNTPAGDEEAERLIREDPGGLPPRPD